MGSCVSQKKYSTFSLSCRCPNDTREITNFIRRMFTEFQIYIFTSVYKKSFFGGA